MLGKRADHTLCALPHCLKIKPYRHEVVDVKSSKVAVTKRTARKAIIEPLRVRSSMQQMQPRVLHEEGGPRPPHGHDARAECDHLVVVGVSKLAARLGRQVSCSKPGQAENGRNSSGNENW